MKFIKKYFAVLTGLFVFLIYLTTLAPSVVEIDSGELTTVQALLGIAHPTGYPLFTMIGHLFSLIPFPFSKVFQLNLLTAIWCSLAVGVFVYTAKFILDNIHEFKVDKPVKKTIAPKKKGKKEKSLPNVSKVLKNEITESKRFFAPVLGGLILAFSRTFWFQSTSVEVYSLQLFLFTLIIFSLVRAFISKEKTFKLSLKNPWIVFAIFLALGFSNHMTTLLILPAAAYLFFLKFGFNKESFIKIGLMLIFFIPLLIIMYSYLPIRAAQNPPLNWGNPTDLAKIYRHVSGKQYQVWLFTSITAAKKQLIYFINNLPNEFSIGLFIALIGLFFSYKIGKRIFVFLLILFLFTVLYSINYEIHDIDSYFLLAYIALGFFSVFGIVYILNTLKLNKYSYLLSTSLILIFIVVQVYSNYSEVNQSDTYIFKDYTKGLIGSTNKNSLILSYQWDYFVSASYYFQYVENYRRDVTIVDKELLRRSWYYHQIQTDHPHVLDSLHTEVNLFLDALKPFESGGNFDSQLLERLYQGIMTGLVETNIHTKDVYIGPELFENEMQKGQFRLPAGYTLVPELFLFKVAKGNAYVPAPDPNFKLRLPEDQNDYSRFIENTVGSMLARRALYEMHYDKVERARIYINKIKQDFPDYRIPESLLNVIEK